MSFDQVFVSEPVHKGFEELLSQRTSLFYLACILNKFKKILVKKNRFRKKTPEGWEKFPRHKSFIRYDKTFYSRELQN